MKNNYLEKLLNSRYFNNEKSPFCFNYELNNPNVFLIIGNNSCGKSLLRKILHNYHHKDNVEFLNSSMEDRCKSGIQRAFIYGSEEDDSSGFNSAKFIKKAFSNREKAFSIMLDEPEIGCSEELSYSLVKYMLKNIPNMTNLNCLYVITHSRVFAKTMLDLNPSFIYMHLKNKNPMTLNEWLNREIKEIDLEEMYNLSLENWRIVEKLRKE